MRNRNTSKLIFQILPMFASGRRRYRLCGQESPPSAVGPTLGKVDPFAIDPGTILNVDIVATARRHPPATSPRRGQTATARVKTASCLGLFLGRAEPLPTARLCSFNCGINGLMALLLSDPGSCKSQRREQPAVGAAPVVPRLWDQCCTIKISFKDRIQPVLKGQSERASPALFQGDIRYPGAVPAPGTNAARPHASGAHPFAATTPLPPPNRCVSAADSYCRVAP